MNVLFTVFDKKHERSHLQFLSYQKENFGRDLIAWFSFTWPSGMVGDVCHEPNSALESTTLETLWLVSPAQQWDED